MLIIWRTTKMQAWVQFKYLICFKWVQIDSCKFGPWIESKVGCSLSKDNDLMVDVSLVRSFKIICSSILSVFSKLLNNLNLLSDMKIMAFQSRSSCVWNIFLSHTSHSYTCALFSHVNNSQIYSMWFVESSHFLTYKLGQRESIICSCRKLNFGGVSKVLIFFNFFLWWANQIG
jgi:hypothetical protein